MTTDLTFLQLFTGLLVVLSNVNGPLRDAPEEISAKTALVAQVLVKETFLMTVPQVSSHPVLRVRHGGTQRTPECQTGGLLVGFALVRVQTGLEVEAVTADVTDVRLVSLLLAALVVFLHVVGEVEDGGQHGIAHLTLQVHRSLGVVLGRGPRLFLDIFRKVDNSEILLILQLVLDDNFFIVQDQLGVGGQLQGVLNLLSDVDLHIVDTEMLVVNLHLRGVVSIRLVGLGVLLLNCQLRSPDIRLRHLRGLQSFTGGGGCCDMLSKEMSLNLL